MVHRDIGETNTMLERLGINSRLRINLDNNNDNSQDVTIFLTRLAEEWNKNNEDDKDNENEDQEISNTISSSPRNSRNNNGSINGNITNSVSTDTSGRLRSIGNLSSRSKITNRDKQTKNKVAGGRHLKKQKKKERNTSNTNKNELKKCKNKDKNNNNSNNIKSASASASESDSESEQSDPEAREAKNAIKNDNKRIDGRPTRNNNNENNKNKNRNKKKRKLAIDKANPSQKQKDSKRRKIDTVDEQRQKQVERISTLLGSEPHGRQIEQLVSDRHAPGSKQYKNEIIDVKGKLRNSGRLRTNIVSGMYNATHVITKSFGELGDQKLQETRKENKKQMGFSKTLTRPLSFVGGIVGDRLSRDELIAGRVKSDSISNHNNNENSNNNDTKNQSIDDNSPAPLFPTVVFGSSRTHTHLPLVKEDNYCTKSLVTRATNKIPYKPSREKEKMNNKSKNNIKGDRNSAKSQSHSQLHFQSHSQHHQSLTHSKSKQYPNDNNETL